MKPGRVLRPKVLVRADLQDNPDLLYCYGDNMEERGMGGQASQMRGEPNAIGVPTKWKPDMTPDAFFRDSDFQTTAVRLAITSPFRRMRRELMTGRTLVIPADGLGTGLAQLRQRAPLIYGYIGGWITALEDIAAEGNPE